MSKIKVFKENVKIGGYLIPADFEYMNLDFISKLSGMEFFERLQNVLSLFGYSDNQTEKFFSDLKKSGASAEVVGFEDGNFVLELFDGYNLNYEDYLFKFDGFSEIAGLISVLVSAYVDMCDMGEIEMGDKINIGVSFDGGILPISAYLAKVIGLPINIVYAGSDKENLDLNGFKVVKVEEEVKGEIIFDYFEEYGYPLDGYSVKGIYAVDELDEGELPVLFPLLCSPYLDARSVVKHMLGKNEISVDKAVKQIYEETAIEVPKQLKEGKIQAFFNEKMKISLKDVVSLLKEAKHI